jgi:glycosyltransferase involved in cell wall biosynthesis
VPIGLSGNIQVGGLVPYPHGLAPSQRFRIEQWRPWLLPDGIAVDLIPFADAKLMRVLHQRGRMGSKVVAGIRGLARRAMSLSTLRKYDAILVHRAAFIAGPAFLERGVFAAGRSVIFDFDDAIFRLHTSTANRRFGWLKAPGRTSLLCRLATHVVAGNEYLAAYARQHNPNVTVIPSSVDTSRFEPCPKKIAGERLVLGWTGSSTSQTYLEAFAPILRDLIANFDLEIRVHSDRRPELPGIPYVWRPWSPDTEVEELAEFDIGIMPMPDDEWAKGKCAMKALLYMSMGIPTICTAVGTNREVIQHGENGLLALTRDDWMDCVRSLVSDCDLRKRLGDAGRQTVIERYSMTACAAQFAEVVRSVVPSKRKVTPTDDVVSPITK